MRASRSLALLSLLLLAPTACEFIAGTKSRKLSTAGTSGYDARTNADAVATDGGLGTGGATGADGAAPTDSHLDGSDTRRDVLGIDAAAGTGGAISPGGVTATGGAAGTGGTMATGGNLGADAGPDLPNDAPLKDDAPSTRDAATTGGMSGSGGKGGTGTGGTATGGTATGGAATGGASSVTTSTGGTGASGGTGSGGAGGAGGSPSLRPSCDGLAASCGPNLDGDCCASTSIPGGSFNRSNDPSFPATVSNYRLDTYEITVGRFRKFVAAYPGSKPEIGSGKNPNNPSDTGWDASWTASLPGTKAALVSGIQCSGNTWNTGDDSLPMNCITWFEAEAFCIWDGGRLPTALEWDYAAAGGAEERYYPWSVPPTNQTIDQSYAVYESSAPATVGSRAPKGDAKWGQADMAGNLHEWVQDFGGPTSSGSCNDCANLTGGTDRFIRGGSYPDTPIQFRVSQPMGNLAPPSTRAHNYGARCVRSVGSGGADGGSGGGGADGSGSGGADGACTSVDAGREETFTVLACGTTPTPTSAAYTGVVTLTVSGVLQNTIGVAYQDGFYTLNPADTSKDLAGCPDCFRYNRASEAACLCSYECASTSHPVSALLVGPYPAYNPSHVYTVQLNLGSGAPERLRFGMADCGCSDNEGIYTVTLVQDACGP